MSVKSWPERLRWSEGRKKDLNFKCSTIIIAKIIFEGENLIPKV